MTDQSKLRKKLIKQCDTLFSEIIKIRDNYTCQRCKSNIKQLNTCHFYSRSNKALRWEVLNAACLCVGCHFWGHKNPLEFSEWYKDFVGEKNMTILQLKKSNRLKTSVVNLKAMLQYLEREKHKAQL